MRSKIIIGALIGALIGCLLGYRGQCSGGTCNFTCTPARGALFGLFFGVLITASIARARRGPAYIPSDNVVKIRDEAQLVELQKSNPLLLVDFYADWCGPCQQLKPILHRLADNYAGKVLVAEVDITRAKALAAAYEVNAIPDIRIFHNGSEVEKLIGGRGSGSYAMVLDKWLEQDQD